MGNAVRFRQTTVPRQKSEQARVKVVQGPDVGATYVLTGSRATVGRGEDNDVVVSDLKASRKHAEFAQVAGGWTVKDLGSANGILHNNKPTRAANIKSGDTVTFGETTLEFVGADAATLMLVAPPRDLGQIHSDHAAFEAQRKKVRNFGAGVPAARGAPAGGGNKRLLVYGAAALGVGAILYFGETDPITQAKKAGRKNIYTEDLAKYLPPTDMSMSKPVEQFFKTGFREYMAGNYLRAKAQFQTVLQMSPGHPLATIYLENCEKRIEHEVDFHLKSGKKSMSAGKLRDAKGHYEAVLRILFQDQSNSKFKEAQDQLDQVLKELSGGRPSGLGGTP